MIMFNYIKLYIIVFLLFLSVNAFAATNSSPVGSTNGLLQAILDETLIIRADLDQIVSGNLAIETALNAQNLAWSQSMSFLAGLLSGSAFVMAATRKW